MKKSRPRIELVGKRFGRLVVLKWSHDKNGYGVWECKCDCGKIVHVVTGNLTSGNSNSCGCLRKDLLRVGDSGHGRKFQDRTGERHASFTVLGFAGRASGNQSIWDCLCDCGTIKKLHNANLGRTKSCGCKRVRQPSLIKQYRSEYGSMCAMIHRCTNPNIEAYAYYGAKGVKVCKEWDSLAKFADFLKYMGPKPTPKHSIDRFPDLNGNYEPGNVRWATSAQQSRNKKNNVWFSTSHGNICRADLVNQHAVCSRTFVKRMERGLSMEASLLLQDLRTRAGGCGINPKFKKAT